MRTRFAGFTFGVLLLALSIPVEAQQAGKVYRVGYLTYLSRTFTSRTLKAFRQKLRELGYVEGQNLVLEWRSAQGEDELRTELAGELVQLKVDVIVTPPSPDQVRLWQRLTRSIPIVMGGLRVDPVEAGLVDSLARPGGNITGVINLDFKLHAKRLELLKEVSPGLSRVAILWDEEQQEQGMKEVEATAQALGLQIQSLDVWDGLDSGFAVISQERTDALIVAHSAATIDHRARIIEFAAKRRLPTIYAQRRFVRAGGLMSYSADRRHLHRRVGAYVDKILKGAKPADLPIEQPTKFEFVINLKTAKALGLMIPPAVLLQATKVIK